MKKYRLSSLLVTFVLALTLLAPFSALALLILLSVFLQ